MELSAFFLRTAFESTIKISIAIDDKNSANWKQREEFFNLTKRTYKGPAANIIFNSEKMYTSPL